MCLKTIELEVYLF